MVAHVCTSLCGAVNMPVPETVPAVVVQVTAGLVEFWVVPLNCCLVAEVTVAVPGVRETLSGGITVTVAVADLVGSSTLVAVMRTMVFCVTFGEVNMPPPEIVPSVAVQVTRVTSVLFTVAVNTCCFSAFMVTLVGLRETLTAGVTVTVAVAESLGSAWLFAVIVTVVSVLTDGAVNIPELVIDPCVVDQVTAVSVEFVTFEVNCCVSREGMLTVLGVI